VLFPPDRQLSLSADVSSCRRHHVTVVNSLSCLRRRCLLQQTALATAATDVSSSKQPLLPLLPMVHTLSHSSAQTGQNGVT
jgi:hypothetical protein